MRPRLDPSQHCLLWLHLQLLQLSQSPRLCSPHLHNLVLLLLAQLSPKSAYDECMITQIIDVKTKERNGIHDSLCPLPLIEHLLLTITWNQFENIENTVPVAPVSKES
jgi:hypothetical protein